MLRLDAQGRTLRQIGAELGVPWTPLGHQPRQAGVIMRRGGPPTHPARQKQILEPHAKGLTWREVADQVDMTVSGAWSRYRRPGRVLHLPGAAQDDTGDRNYLVLAKPNMIMNNTRLRDWRS
jgi:hypothetical protein